MKRFKSLEELNEERRTLINRFNDKLPTYLIDFFDKKHYAFEFTKEKIARAYKKSMYSDDDRREFIQKKNEQFWRENEATVTKELSHTHFEAKYKEPPRGVITDEERALSAEEIRVLVKLCEKDLYLFAIRYFPHYLKRPSSRFHKFLYKTLSREIGSNPSGIKRAVAAPRANAKSAIVSNVFPLWCICYNKKRFIILLSDTLSQAEDFLYDIKYELEMNEKLIRDFPKATGKGPIWRTNEIITNNEVKMLALGTGQKIRGRRFGIYRPDMVIGDDIENSDMVRSEVQRNFIRYDWFNKEVLFAGGEVGAGTDFLIVGTSIGKDALLNALLDSQQYPDWIGLRFEAVEQFHDPSVDHLWQEWTKIYKDRFDLDRKQHAKEFFEAHEKEMLTGTRVLWPEGDPYYNLMEYKLSNPSGFLTEKQNAPVDLTKVYVMEEDLHFEYLNNLKWSACVERGMRRGLVFGALDPSLGKKSKTGDYSAIVTLVRDPDTGYIFVIGIDLKRRKVEEQIEAVLRFHSEYKYKLFGIETNAFQLVVADNLRKLSKQSGMYVPIEELVNYQDKKLRFESIVPFIKDGTIVFDSDKAKGNNMYATGIEQICTFTGESDEHDDAPDALEMAFRIAKAPLFRMLTKTNKREFNGR